MYLRYMKKMSEEALEKYIESVDEELITEVLQNIESRCVDCAKLGLTFASIKYIITSISDIQIINYITDIAREKYFPGFYVSVGFDDVDFDEVKGHIILYISWDD